MKENFSFDTYSEEDSTWVLPHQLLLAFEGADGVETFQEWLLMEGDEAFHEWCIKMQRFPE